jgi:hypothetical protein
MELPCPCAIGVHPAHAFIQRRTGSKEYYITHHGFWKCYINHHRFHVLPNTEEHFRDILVACDTHASYSQRDGTRHPLLMGLLYVQPSVSFTALSCFSVGAYTEQKQGAQIRVNNSSLRLYIIINHFRMVPITTGSHIRTLSPNCWSMLVNAWVKWW